MSFATYLATGMIKISPSKKGEGWFVLAGFAFMVLVIAIIIFFC